MVISWSRDAWFDRGIWTVGSAAQTEEIKNPTDEGGIFSLLL
jgi:hypothetical protein